MLESFQIFPNATIVTAIWHFRLGKIRQCTPSHHEWFHALPVGQYIKEAQLYPAGRVANGCWSRPDMAWYFANRIALHEKASVIARLLHGLH